MEQVQKGKALKRVDKWGTAKAQTIIALEKVVEEVLEIMSRPRMRRRIGGNPSSIYFKPAGIRKIELQKIELDLDEFEAIRLIDFQEIEQVVAAEKMRISQPTLSRILKSARKKISDAIINGKAIKINYEKDF